MRKCRHFNRSIYYSNGIKGLLALVITQMGILNSEMATADTSSSEKALVAASHIFKLNPEVLNKLYWKSESSVFIKSLFNQQNLQTNMKTLQDDEAFKIHSGQQVLCFTDPDKFNQLKQLRLSKTLTQGTAEAAVQSIKLTFPEINKYSQGFNFSFGMTSDSSATAAQSKITYKAVVDELAVVSANDKKQKIINSTLKVKPSYKLVPLSQTESDNFNKVQLTNQKNETSIYDSFSSLFQFQGNMKAEAVAGAPGIQAEFKQKSDFYKFNAPLGPRAPLGAFMVHTFKAPAGNYRDLTQTRDAAFSEKETRLNNILDQNQPQKIHLGITHDVPKGWFSEITHSENRLDYKLRSNFRGPETKNIELAVDWKF